MNEITKALPTTPATIPASTSLDELNEISKAWISQARAENVPDVIWGVLFYLGHTVRVHGHPSVLVWSNGAGVSVIGNEHSEMWSLANNTFVKRRGFTVWVPNGFKRVNVLGEIDNIVLNSVPVCQWSWNISGDEIIERPDSLLFVNGVWVESVLRFRTQAAREAARREAGSAEIQRRALAEKLLIGMDV